MNSIPVNKDFIETVKAQILNSEYLIEPIYDVRRFDNNGIRYYAKIEGDKITFAPSVTAIERTQAPLSPGLMQFYKSNTDEEIAEISESSANYGTYLHSVFERLLRGNQVVLDDLWIKADIQQFYESKGWETYSNKYIEMFKQDVIGFIQFNQDYELEPIALEYPVFYDDQYAGSIDFVGRINYKGVKYTCIIDWKSGRKDFYETNEIQLYAYALAWNKMFPDYQVDRFYNYGCKNYNIPIGKTVKPYRFKDQTNSENIWKWHYWLEMFHRNKGDIKVRHRVKAIPVNLKTEVDTLVEEYDVIKELKEGI